MKMLVEFEVETVVFKPIFRLSQQKPNGNSKIPLFPAPGLAWYRDTNWNSGHASVTNNISFVKKYKINSGVWPTASWLHTQTFSALPWLANWQANLLDKGFQNRTVANSEEKTATEDSSHIQFHCKPTIQKIFIRVSWHHHVVSSSILTDAEVMGQTHPVPSLCSVETYRKLPCCILFFGDEQ